MRRTTLSLLTLALTGCPPWIRPADHQDGDRAEPITDDISGALDGCDTLEPGGTSYLLGELDWGDGDEVYGVEQIAIFANPAWIAEGGEDCVHTFDSGGTVSTGEDGTYLYMTWNWSETQSTCSREDFFVPLQTEVRWTLMDDGGAIRLLGESGEVVALGTIDDGWIEYVSAGYCVLRQEEPAATLTE